MFFLAFHSQVVDRFKVSRRNVYFYEIPLQQAITCLKHRLYAKFMTSRS
jgi:hypothetical protein